MGLFARVFSFLVRDQASAPALYTPSLGVSAPQQSYPNFSRAYMGNEIVFSAIEMLATSAGEPEIVGRRYRRNAPTIRNEEKRLRSRGIPLSDIKTRLIENGFYEDLPNHPLVNLLNDPNPFMSRGQMWGTVVMDRCLAGNAYLLKVRRQAGILKGSVAELWRLRPDRVKVIPSAANFIEGYEYSTGKDKITFAADDVIHFKTRHPLNDYYGMSPLQAVSERLSVDNEMRTFLRTFFERGGAGPGAVLAIKNKLNQEAKDDIRNRFRGQFGGAKGFHELLVLDQSEATYTQMGLNRGLRDALPKELNDLQEARIAMVFGIPGSILGLLIGYESSSYANKRQDWQVFWDLTMTPLLSDLDDTLNLSLIKSGDFGAIDDVCFDLCDIKALQEDVDKLHERARADFLAAGLTWSEYRELIGRDPEVSTSEIIVVPSNMTAQKISELGSQPEPPAPPPAPIDNPVNIIYGEVHCRVCGRFVGENLAVGSRVVCPKDGSMTVEELNAPKTITIDVVRDEEGRVLQLTGGG